MPRLLRIIFWPTLLFLLGGSAAYFLCSMEIKSVANQMIGYPQSDIAAHRLRPWLLGLACMLPFISSFLYLFLDRLDRYTLRIFLNSFGICFTALFTLMLLEDVQDNLGEFKDSGRALAVMGQHYLIRLPSLLVFVLPYSLMLGLLWSLGKMSANQEIVSMIQTGRSIRRIVSPLIGFGIICALLCTICNFHWAPVSDGLEKSFLDEASGKSASEAKHVAYQNHNNTRQWYVGRFPFTHSQGDPLQGITIAVIDANNHLKQRILASSAKWSLKDRKWTFFEPVIFDFSKNGAVKVTKHKEPLITDWHETPHEIIKPGLKAHHLGIPGLNSWLKNHHDSVLSDRRAYLTHWHYRFAQPFICLIIILLAAPLGIVFNRRGVGGGVAIAIFLCAGMIFCSTVFPTLGESGHLSPFIAAWATNLIFCSIAMMLFHRRMTGQPIYQSIRNLFSA